MVFCDHQVPCESWPDTCAERAWASDFPLPPVKQATGFHFIGLLWGLSEIRTQSVHFCDGHRVCSIHFNGRNEMKIIMKGRQGRLNLPCLEGGDIGAQRSHYSTKVQMCRCEDINSRSVYPCSVPCTLPLGFLPYLSTTMGITMPWMGS